MKDWRKSPEPPSMMGVGGEADGTEDDLYAATTSHGTSVSGPSGQFSRASPSTHGSAAETGNGLTERSSADHKASEAAHVPTSKLRARTKSTLVEMARRVVAQRLHLYDSFGDAPFRLVRPLLEQCAPRKLWILEEASPHLIDETDYIWRRNSLRDFKDLKEGLKEGRSLEQLVDAAHGWREVYRDRMVQDYEAKQAATEHVKQKYALLRASKEATQVRIVEEATHRRRKGTGFAARQPKPNLTQGQRMLSKARRTAHTHAQAVRAPRSSTRTASMRALDTVAASADAATCSGQQSPVQATTGVRRARTPPGFERIATRGLDEGLADAERAMKRTKSSNGAGHASPSGPSRGGFLSPQPATPTSPNTPLPSAVQRGPPPKRGISVTKRRVTPVVVLSSDEEM